MISWLERNRGISWTIVFITFGFIFYVSGLTFEEPTIGKLNILSVVYHILAFFFLTLFLFFASIKRKWNFKKITLVILISGLYAVLDELHQFFVPGRFSSLEDVFLDLGGIILASVIYFIMIAWKTSKND